METTNNVEPINQAMSEVKPSSIPQNAGLLLNPVSWNRLKEQQKHKRRLLEAMAAADHNEDEDRMLRNLSKAIIQNPKDSQKIAERMAEVSMVKRPSLRKMQEGGESLPGQNRRRRFQRRNSFVIHKNKQFNSKTNLFDEMYKSTPNLSRQKSGVRKAKNTSSLNTSWHNAASSSQNATWSNVSSSQGNASWTNMGDTNWIAKLSSPVSFDSQRIIPPPNQQAGSTKTILPDEVMKSPEPIKTKKTTSSFPSFDGSLTSFNRSFTSVLDPINMEESPRSPRLLVSRDVQQNIDLGQMPDP